uniref:Uncharacterized protein n=1 Tax=Anguilla anguilla TaxID=7936 RepID=A0A0E9UD27_ANGAN
MLAGILLVSQSSK